MLLLLTFVAPLPVRAIGTIEARASTDVEVIEIGDPVLLKVEVTAPNGYTVMPPDVDLGLGDFELLQTLPPERQEAASGMLLHTYGYLVTTFQAYGAAASIRSLKVPYVAPDGVSGAVGTVEVPLSVASVIGPNDDTSDLKPLRPPLELSGGPSLGLAILALAAILAAFACRSTRRQSPLRARRRDPVEDAVLELERLARVGLAEQGRLKEHYALLSACLRRYVLEAHDLPAQALTPRELSAQMSSRQVEPAFAGRVHATLLDSDLVRFDHAAPSGEEARAAVLAALAAIRGDR
jgi:hypothetical protein